jgi:hypothetical protein
MSNLCINFTTWNVYLGSINKLNLNVLFYVNVGQYLYSTAGYAHMISFGLVPTYIVYICRRVTKSLTTHHNGLVA